MTPDLVTLSWCLGEIREALAQADRLLERQLQSEAEELSSIRAARSALHQASGALQVVAIDGAPLIVQEAETLLDHVERGEVPFGAEVASRVARASRALVEHLELVLGGEANQPLYLYPYYRDLLEARGAERVHAADLFFPELDVDVPPAGAPLAHLTPAALAAARAGFERGLLLMMRDPNATHGPQAMHEAVATVAASPLAASHRRFWWVTEAFFAAIERGELEVDVEIKRLLARFNLQLRKVVQERAPVAERLLRDMLFALVGATGVTGAAAEVRAAFSLESALPPDFETPRYGQLDARVLKHARESLARVGSSFDRISRTGADSGDLAQALDAFRDATAEMPVNGLRELGAAMAQVHRASSADDSTLGEDVALEMATAILFAGQVLEHGARPGSEHDRRSAEMAQRLRASLSEDAEIDDAVPQWLRELSQSAQERLTMAAFVVETVANLRLVEKQLDAFFRDPSERGGLAECPPALQQVAGALQLLGHDEAARGAKAVVAHVEAVLADQAIVDTILFERIASSVGAIGFFVEGLQHPDRVSGRFALDEFSGDFTADLGVRVRVPRSARTSQRAPDQDRPDRVQEASHEASFEGSIEEHAARAASLYDALLAAQGDAALRAQLRATLQRLRDAATLADDSQRRQGASDATAVLDATELDLARLATTLRAAGVSVSQPSTAAPLPSDESSVDGELLEVFIEEAGEVLAAIAEHVVASRESPRDQQHLTTIRRGFHTLKGSSRMVGLERFGEAGWAMEQVLNQWLSDERAGEEALYRLVETARERMTTWVAELGADPASGARIDPVPIVNAATALRTGSPVEAGQSVSPQAGEPEQPEALSDESIEAAATEAMLGVQPDASPAGQTEAAANAWAMPAQPVELPLQEEAEALSHEATAAPLCEETESSLGEPLEAVVEEPSAPMLDEVASLQPEQDQALAPTQDDTISIGDVVVPRGLYMVFLGEADDLIRVLESDVRDWREQRSRGASESGVRAAHSLAGSASLMHLDCVQQPAKSIEKFMLAQVACGSAPEAADLEVLRYGIERMAAMLHQFAGGTMPPAETVAIDALAALAANWSAREPAVATQTDIAHAGSAEGEAPALPADEFDADLLPIFIEEASDAMPQVGANLAGWLANPDDASLPAMLMRQLHTIKGSARMAGAMALGQLVHEIETRVETMIGLASVPASLIEELVAEHDRVSALFDAIRQMAAGVPAAVVRNAAASATVQQAAVVPPAPPSHDVGAAGPQAVATAAQPAGTETEQPAQVDVAKAADPVVAQAAVPTVAQPADQVVAQPAAASTRTQPLVRVRADLLDKLVNDAGEVSIARSRVDNQLGSLRQSLADLTENVGRLRSQLREIEIQAESQIQARIAQTREHERSFDPLEFDRYTRFQELTRMLAESVDDVATVQANATRGLDEASKDLHRQGQVMRDLQQNLMRVRMVQFGTISDRLYRVVRQAAKELDKRVHLDIRGSTVELDRGVLETMSGPIEHLLRNAVAHGVEPRGARVAAGKAETGELAIEVRQEGREVVLEFSDDGAGLDFERIRARAQAAGLIAANAQLSERELGDLIFVPGFTTASEVTEISGRGVGMDVVRADVASLGGRVEIESRRGEGTRFTISLPVTLAVAQVVLVSTGNRRYAVPSSSVEQMLQLKPQVLASAYTDGSVDWQGARVPLFYLGTLVEDEGQGPVAQHYSPVVIVRAGGQRIALHCDDVTRNQEIVVKNPGPQAARVRGITGATVLGSGEIVLIINPVSLAQAIAGEVLDRALAAPVLPAVSAAPLPPVVMVVDDSLTVRRVTQRLLVREGYQVLLAKDGVDALRQLQDNVPDVMLLDIEMPRMDGFDLTRNLRSDSRFAHIPIVMITSRTADKHREYAASLGVNVYLGKPYAEDELLGHIEAFTGERARAGADQAFTTA